MSRDHTYTYPPFPLPAMASERADRVVTAVEYVIDFVVHTTGPRDQPRLPENMAHRLRLSEGVVNDALAILHWRGFLAPQQDPATGATRLLPDPAVVRERRAKDYIADRIASRIKLGPWAGDKFPTVEEMRDVFQCGLHTVCDALKVLQSQGIVHKAFSGAPAGSRRGGLWVWRPVEFVGDAHPRAVTDRLRTAIVTGELTGLLPYKRQMALQYNVDLKFMAEAYDQLHQEGLIGKGWFDRGNRPCWYVVGAPIPDGFVPGDTKVLAVARAVCERLPYWLAVLPDGTWARRWLPAQEVLKRFYNTNTYIVHQVMELLVSLRILERADHPQRRYVPRPPADGGSSAGLTFRHHKRRKRRWQRASAPVEWLPLPSSGDDPAVTAVRNTLSRRARTSHKTQTAGGIERPPDVQTDT